MRLPPICACGKIIEPCYSGSGSNCCEDCFADRRTNTTLTARLPTGTAHLGPNLKRKTKMNYATIRRGSHKNEQAHTLARRAKTRKTKGLSAGLARARG